MINMDINSYNRSDKIFLAKLVVFIIMIISLLATTNAAIAEDDNNDRAYFNFSNAGVDATGRFTTITATGSPAISTGIIGNAYRYSGAQNYDVGSLPVSAFPFTYNVWLKTNSSTGSQGVMAIGESGGNNDYFGIYTESGNISLVARNGATGLNAITGTQASNNTWFMVTAVFASATDRRLYVNGINIGNDTVSTAIGASVSQFAIGQNVDNQIDQFFTGVIDEASVWNKSLTSAEVLELYNSGDGFGWNFEALTPTITTNLSSVYATQNIGVSVSAASSVNMSYSLNGASYVDICTECTSSLVNLTGVPVSDNNNITWRAINSAGTQDNAETFSVQPFQYFRFNDTSSGSLVTSYTFGGESSVGNLVTLDARNYTFGVNNLTFTKTGYITTVFQVTFNNSMQLNTTYNVSDAEIIVNIKDKDTLATVTGENFTLEFIGPTGFEATTTTGIETITGLLAAGDYELFMTSENYTSEFLDFTFTNQEQLNLTIYTSLSNATNTGSVVISVIDVNGQPISDVSVSARQWNTPTSSYISVSEGKTIDDGTANLNIVLNTKQYIFRATKSGATVDSVEQVIATVDNGKTVTLTLAAGTGTPVNFLFQNINYNASNLFNSTTNISTVTFDWNNRDGTDVTACVNAYRVQIGNEVLLTALNCTTSSSGQIIRGFTINETYDLYILKAEFLQGGEYYPVETFRVYSEGSIFKQLENYQLHYFILIFLQIMAVMVGITLQNVYIGSIGLILASLASIMIAPTIMTTTVAMFLTFVGVVTLIGGTKP